MTRRPTTRGRQRATALKLRSAFTLLELMVSIAIVLILILGVNQVFSLTGQTVGAGQALSTVNRDARNAQAVIYTDFHNAAVSDGPFFFIRSERTYAFRSKRDQEQDRDQQPSTIDLNANNIEGDSPGEIVAKNYYNFRNHRVDRVGFFTRGDFRRQTGNEGVTFAADQTSREAYIWYGHLKRQDNTNPPPATPTNTWDPGDTSAANVNNRYATDWMLGRMVMLLQEPDATGVIKDRNGVAQQYIKRVGGLSPLSLNSNATDGTNLLQWGRYDLAGTSIDGYRQVLTTLLGATPSAQWATAVSNFRFQGEPKPTRPLTGYGAARTNPVFIPACTQFIVEFAGDYVTQDPATGRPAINTRGDGKLDFVVDNGVQKVRWYGFPRDVNDDTKIDTLLDVVPVRDMMKLAGLPAQTFEKSVDQTLPQSDYSSLLDTAQYTVAWSPADMIDPTTNLPATPRMIRITFTVDDPAGRVGAGQTFEYVVDLH